MHLFEVFLTIMSLAFITGTPFYLYLRSKMVRNDFTYSKRHIFKVVVLHLSAMLIITAIHAAILFALLREVQNITTQKLQYFIFQTILIGIALYGGGIYVASILLEHFTTHINKKVLNLKKTLRFLHGPVSHTLFELAYMLAFWNIALIQTDIFVSGSLQNISIFTILGSVTGIAFAIATIGNGTYLIFEVISIISLPFFLKLVSYNTTGGIYIWGFMFSNIIFVAIFILIRKVTKRQFYWYMPINLFRQHFPSR